MDRGYVSTIIGDGSNFDAKDPQTHSHSGQDALEPIGGIPWAVTLDPEGILYFSSLDQGYVGRLNPGGTITHIIDELHQPMVMSFDGDGNLYIPEYGMDRIQVITPEGAYVILEGIVKNPMSARFDQRKNPILYVTDTGHHQILAYDLMTGKYDVVAGTGMAGYVEGEMDATRSPLFYPIDLDVNEDGVMVIADGMNNRLRAVNLSDDPQMIAGQSVQPGNMITIAGQGPNCPDAKDSLSNM